MIHQQKDEEKIMKMKDILRKFVTLPSGRQLTFCLEDIGIPYINDEYEYFEKSLQRSRYKFIYVGDDDDDDNDGRDAFWWQMKQHYALNEMIKKQDRSVVPVTDNPWTKISPLLDIFRRLDIWKLLRKRSLNDISDVEKLSSSNVNVPTVDFVRHMFDPTVLPTPRQAYYLTYFISVDITDSHICVMQLPCCCFI